MSYLLSHSSLKRFFVGSDDNVGVDLQVRITVLGPNDEDASGITPEETTESEETFGLQIRDAEDAAVFVGEPHRIATMLEEALDKIREVIREQDEDSK